METTVPVGAHRSTFVTHFYLSVILFFIGVSILCQAIAFAIPGWLVVDMTAPRNAFSIMSVFNSLDITQNYALWYVEVCSIPHPRHLHEEEKLCTTRSYVKRHGDGISYRNAALRAEDVDYSLFMTYPAIVTWQIQVTLALICTIFSTYLVYMQRLRISLLNQGVSAELPTKCRFAVALVLTLISAGGLTIPVCKIAVLATRLNEYPRYVKTHSPGGLIVEAIGVTSLLIAALCLVASVWKGGNPRVVNDAAAPGQQMVLLVANQPAAVEGKIDYAHFDDPPTYDECVPNDKNKYVSNNY